MSLTLIAFVALHWVITDVLALALTSLLIGNIANLLFWLLPFAVLPWLLPVRDSSMKVWVLTAWIILMIPMSLWLLIIVPWRFNDIKIGNGDRPQAEVVVDEKYRLVCFETYDAGALGGAFPALALVEDVFPGLERRHWDPDIKSVADSTYPSTYTKKIISVLVDGEEVELPEGFECYPY